MTLYFRMTSIIIHTWRLFVHNYNIGDHGNQTVMRLCWWPIVLLMYCCRCVGKSVLWSTPLPLIHWQRYGFVNVLMVVIVFAVKCCHLMMMHGNFLPIEWFCSYQTLLVPSLSHVIFFKLHLFYGKSWPKRYQLKIWIN